jgi:hypothetical protein
LNPKLARGKNHGYNEPEELYREKVKIPDRLREKTWIDNIVEKRA